MPHTPEKRPWNVQPLIDALSMVDTDKEAVRANAEHIVRCVNERERLIALLKLCVEDLEEWAKSHPQAAAYGAGRLNLSTLTIIEQAKQLLAVEG